MDGCLQVSGRLSATLLLVFCLSVCVACAATELELGWQQFDAGNIEDAYDTFTALFKKSPADPEVNFALGRAAFQNGKLSHALLAFERVLMAEPGNQRARLELARTYHAMGQGSVARKHFRIVLESNPPPRVKESIQVFLKDIERGERRFDYSGTIETSFFYDDNLNYGPESLEIDTTIGTLAVDESSRPRDEYGGSLGMTGRLSYDAGEKDEWLSTVGAAYNQTWLEESREQETCYVQASVGAQQLKSASVLELGLRAAHLDYGHNPYLDIYGCDLAYVKALTRRWRSTTSASAEFRDFEIKERDAGYYTLAQSVSYSAGQVGHLLSATVRGFYDDARSLAYRNGGGDAVVGATYRLPWRGDVYSQFQYRRTVYEDITYSLLQSTARKDNQYQATIGVRQRVAGNVRIDLYYQYVENQSTFGLYDYTRNFTGCKASVDF